jgi:hypothetical protein
VAHTHNWITDKNTSSNGEVLVTKVPLQVTNLENHGNPLEVAVSEHKLDWMRRQLQPDCACGKMIFF